MSFQSQLLGATTSVLGAKEQQDTIKETENKRQLENQYQSELDALREKEANDQNLFKTLEEQTVYKGEKTIPVREDGKLKGVVNVNTPAPAEPICASVLVKPWSAFCCLLAAILYNSFMNNSLVIQVF